jgi:hypothetical protein
MTNNLLNKILIIFIISAVTYTSKAQDNPLLPTSQSSPFYIGPVVGYNLVQHQGEQMQVPDGPPDLCQPYGDSGANGFYVGVAFEYLLGGAKNSTSSIIGKLLYSTYPSTFEENSSQLPASFNVEDGQNSGEPNIAQSLNRYSREVDYSVLSAEALYKLNIGGTPIGAVVGLAFDFTLNATDVQQMQVINPENAVLIRDQNAIDKGYTYLDGDRTLQFQDGDIDGAAAFRLGLKLGLQYEINLKGFVLVPHIFYNFGITNLVDRQDIVPDSNPVVYNDVLWRVSALQIGIDVRLAL